MIRIGAGRRGSALVLALCAGLSLTGCAPSGQTTWQPGASASASAVRSPAVPSPAASRGGSATITVLGSGDVLLHPGLWSQAQRDAARAGKPGMDFAPLLAGVRSAVSTADLAICHMETPVAPAGGPYQGFPRFSVPPQIVAALAGAGYDSCSTASNHSLDQGTDGIRRTLDALDAAGIKHAGSYRSAADQATVNMLNVRGVKVAHLSYTFSFNGLSRAPGMAWQANLTQGADILAEAHRARAQGAAIVMVSLHWGTEYLHAPNANQVALAKQLMASPDIDLILGCHAHVVQPFEKIGDKWVAYGMGNEVAHHAEPIEDNREGVLPRFTFQQVSPGRWRVVKAEAIAVYMDFTPDNRVVDLAAALADPATPAGKRRTYQRAYDRIKGYLYSRGAGAAGLTMTG